MGLLKTPKYDQDNLEKVETKLKENIQEHSRVTAPPTTVFDHQGPDGTWTPFRAEDCLKIKKAMDKNDDGVVKLDGVPFEVRWGSKATSKKMPARPDTAMIQVNIKNDNTRIVSTASASRSRLAQALRVLSARDRGGMEHALETSRRRDFGTWSRSTWAGSRTRRKRLKMWY